MYQATIIEAQGFRLVISEAGAKLTYIALKLYAFPTMAEVSAARSLSQLWETVQTRLDS